MVPEIVRKVLLQGPNGKRNCTFTKLQQRQCPKKQQPYIHMLKEANSKYSIHSPLHRGYEDECGMGGAKLTST